MTVASLINLFESIDRRAQSYQSISNSPIHSHLTSINMPSRKMKLSLHTIFATQDRSSRSRTRRDTTTAASVAIAVAITQPAAVSRPTQAYPFLARPHTPIHSADVDSPSTAYLSPDSAYSGSPSSSHYTSSRSHRLRRQPSATDLALALEAERCNSPAGSPEILGLGLLEPRPRAVSCTSMSSSVASVSTAASLAEVMSDGELLGGREVVLDGIFEVLERGS